MHPVFDITGRRALVTGSSRGIGRALAEALIEAGAAVTVHARSTPPDVPGAADAVAFDVTDPAAVAAADLAGFEILVNNAGMQHRAPLLDFPDDAWQQLLDTNLTSVFLVSRAVGRGMVARGAGKIVNVASLQSALARPGIAPYAATKGGLKMLTQGMCADWGPAACRSTRSRRATSRPSSPSRWWTIPSSARGSGRARRPRAGGARRISSARCCSSSHPRRTSSTGTRSTSTAACSPWSDYAQLASATSIGALTPRAARMQVWPLRSQVTMVVSPSWMTRLSPTSVPPLTGSAEPSAIA